MNADGRLEEPRKRKVKERKTQVCVGLALLAALLWVWPLQLLGDPAGPYMGAGAAMPQQSTGTAKKKRHSTQRQPAHKSSSTHKSSSADRTSSSKKASSTHQSSSSRPGEARSARRPARRHHSKAQLAAEADRHRRARLHPSEERIQEIQQALSKAGYLGEQPNGRWDDQTREAMRRYQTDHGFPVTGLPEAKSLMKLGLGPHPLPADLDNSSAAAPGAATAGQPPSSSEAQQSTPDSTPQP